MADKMNNNSKESTSNELEALIWLGSVPVLVLRDAETKRKYRIAVAGTIFLTQPTDLDTAMEYLVEEAIGKATHGFDSLVRLLAASFLECVERRADAHFKVIDRTIKDGVLDEVTFSPSNPCGYGEGFKILDSAELA